MTQYGNDHQYLLLNWK